MSGMACRFVCIQETIFEKVAQTWPYLDVSFASTRDVADQTALRRSTPIERAAHQETALLYVYRCSAIDSLDPHLRCVRLRIMAAPYDERERDAAH